MAEYEWRLYSYAEKIRFKFANTKAVFAVIDF